MYEIPRFGALLALTLGILGIAACSNGLLQGFGWKQGAEDGAGRAEIAEMDPVTTGGVGKAVLSLHRRFAYENACRFGLTLTNNLPYKINNISFRFEALPRGGGSRADVTRNFFELEPATSQYREIDFADLTCDDIVSIEVSDPGRCDMAELARSTSQPGDCISRVYIADTPYVTLLTGFRGRVEGLLPAAIACLTKSCA